ncbi:MAG: hypothetical protein AAGJ73_06340 [Pseudomonadota bacterium]
MEKDPRSALEKMTRITILAALVTAAILGVAALSGCATEYAPTAYKACPDGQERVRIGPRGKPAKYVCRDKVDD